MELFDSKSNRLVVSQAKIFLVLMLLVFAVSNLAAAFVFFTGGSSGEGFIRFLLELNLLFLAVFVFGELLLLGGLFWWEKIKFRRK